eukprot:Polyplicarium_translucidae@DN1583_c0_g1_i1.p2
MIKIYGVGRGKGQPSGANSKQEKRKSAGELRLQKELDELELPPQTHMSFPHKDDVMSFFVDIRPNEGFWKNASYRFSFTVSGAYPHEPPKVKCETKIYHPNIDLRGNVCLNILREEWKPVLAISSVVYGLLYLLLEPNPSDPLNHDAAKVLRKDRSEFAAVVRRSIGGGTVQGETFPNILK